MIGDEIQRFKSLALWSAATGDLQDELAEERTVWRYIADHLPYPVRYLGFGRDDRYAAIQQLLASQLPPEAVDVIDGRHDWSAMRELWDRFLQRLVATAPERA
jgi:hypothetical protein